MIRCGNAHGDHDGFWWSDAATYTYKTGESPAADAAKVAFVNSYAASGSVDVNATKTLSGRALVEGEFDFGVQYANGEAAGSDVLTATNAADGAVAFGTLEFRYGDAERAGREGLCHADDKR